MNTVLSQSTHRKGMEELCTAGKKYSIEGSGETAREIFVIVTLSVTIT